MAKFNHLKVFSCAFLSLVIPVASMETNPLRDFSKLRLEPASSSSNTEDYTTSTSTTSRSSSLPSSPSYGGGYNGDFKPSYNDNQMDSYSEIEPGSNNNELYDSSPMMPSMPPSRPLLHNDGDESSGGPNFFSSPQNNPGSNMDKSGGGQNPEDLFFIPQPPSQSFLAEVEYDSGVSATNIPEKGMGGLFDDEDDSGDNPEGGEGEGSDGKDNENQDEYYGSQGGPHYGQENSEDGRRGYGGGSGGPEGGRYNSFGGGNSGSSDYGDY